MKYWTEEKGGGGGYNLFKLFKSLLIKSFTRGY